MTLARVFKKGPFRQTRANRGSEGGIALFMVLAAVTILSVIVTEFTYVAQVNARMAYDSLDQIKALYLAKAGLKISLLRLKAFQNVKSVSGSSGVPGLKKRELDMIWSFPFAYPPSRALSALMPKLGMNAKDSIAKFEKGSSFDGEYEALIESESSKLNLNMILAPYAPQPNPSASPSPDPNGGGGGGSGGGGGNTQPSPGPSFNPEDARRGLQDYLFNILESKINSDDDFAREYRDRNLDFEQLMKNIITWADNTVEPERAPSKDALAIKQAPFYSLTELHMIDLMDDDLFDLFAPGLTVSRTNGINVNAIDRNVLRALVPGITDQEVDDFFKFRDSEEQDNYFKTGEDFLNYIKAEVNVFKRNPSSFDEYKKNLEKRQIRLVTDEMQFKIKVTGRVRQATRVIEAWVMLEDNKDKDKNNNSNNNNNNNNTNNSSNSNPPGNANTTDETAPPKPDAGLKITYMRIS